MIWLFLGAACSDPVQEYSIPKKSDDNWEDWSAKPAGQQGAPVGEALGTAPDNGFPSGQNPDGQPPPVDGGPSNDALGVPQGSAPENAASLDSGVCRPVASSEMLNPNGTGITLTGKIEKSSDLVGSLLLEFANNRGEKSQTNYGVVCGFSQEFEVEIPIGLQDVYVVAFVDVNGDGPSDEDPRGHIGPLSFSESMELDDIEVSLDRPLLPLKLPFIPNMSNVPIANDAPTEIIEPSGDLPPPTTDVGSPMEEPDVIEEANTNGEVPTDGVEGAPEPEGSPEDEVEPPVPVEETP